jgi:hypothetical protein
MTLLLLLGVIILLMTGKKECDEDFEEIAR